MVDSLIALIALTTPRAPLKSSDADAGASPAPAPPNSDPCGVRDA
jgi:hypothetical protein